MIVTSPSSSSSSTDERLVASAALEAAEEQLQTLTASFAGTFVSVERRSAAFQELLQQLRSEVDTVSTEAAAALTALEQQQEQIDIDNDNDNDDNGGENGSGTSVGTGETLAVLAERHRIRRRTLLQHSSLLELLELPNIMDACVRSNLYEEALQIGAFANTLARRHSTESSGSTKDVGNRSVAGTTGNTQSTSSTTGSEAKPKSSANWVVQQVIFQIRSRQEDLRRYLIGRLRAPVTMPQCLEVVTAVRRLNAIDLEGNATGTTTITSTTTKTTTTTTTIYSAPIHGSLEQQHAAMEYQLQIAFLEARDVWLDSSTIDSSNQFSPDGRPALLLGSHEETILDTIERYRTRMFEVATEFNAIFRAQHVAATSTQLLSLWVSRRVQTFLQLLRLEFGSPSHRTYDAAAIRDAVEASVFFSTSLGRLGADFTCQLPAIFEPALLQTITAFWKVGVAQFRETLTVCREAGVAGPLSNETGTNIADEGREACNGDGDPSLEEPQLAPKKLLSLPPLARLVNAVLTGLNELRRCLLPGVFPSLRRCLDLEVLQAIASELLMNERAVLIPGFRGEAAELRAVAAKMQVIFRDLVHPYLCGSLEAAIGNISAAVNHHKLLADNIRLRAKESEAPTEEIPVVEINNEDRITDNEVSQDKNDVVEDEDEHDIGAKQDEHDIGAEHDKHDIGAEQDDHDIDNEQDEHP